MSFISECNALRNIRHRNLAKILTECSSVDFKGEGFKALVFEFIPNGSLEKWLHPEADKQSEMWSLSLIQRLNIAIDVASVLDYFHRHGETPIVNCDIKPYNVLLDGEMTAHVGDFGLSRFLTKSVSKSTSSAGVKGTIGYVPPEYGMANQVSTEGDTYSYGILLLEMFTGKRPTDDTLTEGLSLHEFIEGAFPYRAMDVIDPRMRAEDDDISQKPSDLRHRTQEYLVALLKIGLSCLKENPSERMKIGDAVKEMAAIKETLISVGIEGEKGRDEALKGEGSSYRA